MSCSTEKLASNLARVRQQIANAARRSGRAPDAITLVAVTKYVEAETARALISCGCLDLGESRPQELWAKVAMLNDPAIRWHQIGHLQTNKLAKTVPLIHLLHSVDSLHLLEAINQQSSRLGRVTKGLIEVKISSDEAKHGFRPSDLPEVIRGIDRFPHFRLQGLMAMASLEGGLDQARRDFSALRALRDGLKGECPPDASLEHLSMGMSADFEVAIEEGATIVRIGSALFEDSV